MDVLGPLGHGFTLLSGKKAILVGGGIGTPPILEAAKFLKKDAKVVLGFREQSRVILHEDFAALGGEVIVCTDDGSFGRKGVVTDAVRALLQNEGADIIYACGPTVMLRALAALAKEYGVRCQLSLEERMGCGVGACLVCACKTKTVKGEENFSHVCKDGPVFEAEEVVFDGES